MTILTLILGAIKPFFDMSKEIAKYLKERLNQKRIDQSRADTEKVMEDIDKKIDNIINKEV